MIWNITVFSIFSLLWLIFGAALIFNRESLDQAWSTMTALPWWVQGLIWLLFLPIVVGLWIWEASWPLWVKILLIAGIAWANFWAFLPRQS